MPKKQKHFSVYKAVGNFIGAPFEIIVAIILLGFAIDNVRWINIARDNPPTLNIGAAGLTGRKTLLEGQDRGARFCVTKNGYSPCGKQLFDHRHRASPDIINIRFKNGNAL